MTPIEEWTARLKAMEENAMVSGGIQMRHERMLADHADWLRSQEDAFSRHQQMMLEHDERMVGLDIKLDKIAELLLRGQQPNGH